MFGERDKSRVMSLLNYSSLKELLVEQLNSDSMFGDLGYEGK